MTQAEIITILGQATWDSIQATATEAGCLTGIGQAKTDLGNAQNQSETDTAQAKSGAYKIRLYALRHPAPVLTLDQEKKKKNKAIDQKTGVLISAGFSFNSKTFSLSSDAQRNWAEIHTNKDSANIPDPVPVTTVDDEEYLLAKTDMDSFYWTGFAVIKGHLDSGRALKLQVKAATTIAGVQAVVDNR